MSTDKALDAAPVDGMVIGKPRSRIQRLLNYKRYIDFLIEQELQKHDPETNRSSSGSKSG